MEFKDYEDATKRSEVRTIQLTAFGGDAYMFSRTYNIPPDAASLIPEDRAVMPGYVPAAGEGELWWPYIAKIKRGKQKDGGNQEIALTFVQIIPAE